MGGPWQRLYVQDDIGDKWSRLSSFPSLTDQLRTLVWVIVEDTVSYLKFIFPFLYRKRAKAHMTA